MLEGLLIVGLAATLLVLVYFRQQQQQRNRQNDNANGQNGNGNANANANANAMTGASSRRLEILNLRSGWQEELDIKRKCR